MNQKGVATIVVVVILVALVLVAVGVVWAVISNLIGAGSEDIALNAKCLNIDIKATAVNCTDDSVTDPKGWKCSATFERTGSGTDEIAGIKAVFKNDTAGISSVVPTVGDIESFVGESLTITDTTTAFPTGESGPDSVAVTVYFTKESGEDFNCPQTKEFSNFD